MSCEDSSILKCTRGASILRSLDKVHRSLLGMSDKDYIFSLEYSADNTSSLSLDILKENYRQRSLISSSVEYNSNDSNMAFESSADKLSTNDSGQNSLNQPFKNYNARNIQKTADKTHQDPMKDLHSFKTLSPVAVKALNTNYHCKTVEGRIVEEILTPKPNLNRSCISISLNITKRNPPKHIVLVKTESESSDEYNNFDLGYETEKSIDLMKNSSGKEKTIQETEIENDTSFNNNSDCKDEIDFSNNLQNIATSSESVKLLESISDSSTNLNSNSNIDTNQSNHSKDFIIKSGTLLERRVVSPRKDSKQFELALNQELDESKNLTSKSILHLENISLCSTTELQSPREINNFDNCEDSFKDLYCNKTKEQFTSSTMKGQKRESMNLDNISKKYEDSLVSYDHKQFLKIALEGNDFSDVTCTSMNSEINAMPHNSTLVEKPLCTSISVSTINHSNVPEITDVVSSIGTVDASKLISSYSGTRSPKRLGLFRALYEKARESLRVKRSGNRPKLNKATFFDGSKSQNSSETESFYVEGLIGDSACEMAKRKQLLRAREQCLAKEEFQDSDQQVEVERQLLLSAAKIRALQSVMNKMDYEQNGAINISKSSGSLTITNLIIPLKSCDEREFSQYYVCILSCDRHVHATDYIKAADCKVSFFDANITFKNVKNDFSVKVEVFSLKLRRSLRNYSHESKYNLKKDSTCPSPQILISPTRTFLRNSKRNSPSNKRGFDAESSRFSLQGSFTLDFTNITSHGYYTISGMPHSSDMQAVAEVSISAEVYFPQECTGFLTIGNESGGCAYWNRKWCKLEGWIFKYWNYPEDQDNNKCPSGMIDLRSCVSPEILPADREICSRNFTLLIETKRIRQPGDRNSLVLSCKPTYTVVRNFIAADTRAELIKWQDIFNNVVQTLRQWNTLIPDSMTL